MSKNLGKDITNLCDIEKFRSTPPEQPPHEPNSTSNAPNTPNTPNTPDIGKRQPEAGAIARDPGESRSKPRSRPQNADNNGSNDKPSRAASDNSAGRRRPRDDERSGRNGRADSGNSDKVIGMGDHFPDFLREPSKPNRGGKG